MNFHIHTADSASNQVEAYFRQAIENKVLKPGERLPSNQDLAAQFKVSGTVIHTALSRLVRDGLIERKQKKGSFVRKFQEKANVVLLFGDSLSDETAHYYRAIQKRFFEACRDRKWGSHCWGSLNPDMFPADLVERQQERIIRDNESHPFTGAIEFSPGRKSIIPEVMRKEISTISYGGDPSEVDIHFDSYSFGFDAVHDLVASGCRKISYLCSVWHSHSFTESVNGALDAARKLGISAPQIHLESISIQGYQMEIAMHRRMREIIGEWKRTGFPDGLVVNDDIVMRAIAPAILEAGIKVPRDLIVISEGNEDTRFYYGFPVIRYEISPQAIVKFLLQALENKINGLDVGTETKPHKHNIYHEQE